MFGNRHIDALSAYEANSQFEDTHSELKQFQRKQKKKTKSSSEQFEWIIGERRLKHVETVTLKQLSFNISKLLVELKKDKVSSSYDSVKSIEEDIAAFDGGLNETIASTSMIDTGEGVKQNRERSESILDKKQNLVVDGQRLDQQYVMLEGKVNEHKEALFKLLANKFYEKNCSKEDELLPEKLIAALADARLFENKMTQLNECDGGECNVAMLERILKGQLAAAKEKLDTALVSLVKSTRESDILPDVDEQSNETFRSICSVFKQNISLLEEEDIVSFIKLCEIQRMYKDKERTAFQEYARRRLDIERKGLKDAENLVNYLECRVDSIEAKKQSQLRSNELRLRVRTQLIDRDEPSDIKKSFNEEVSVENSRLKYEIDLLEKKQALCTHSSNKQWGTISIENEVAMEASRLSRHRANKKRTNHREEERKNKIESKRNCDIESSNAEEDRLGRLRALAATVPYYRKIVNATPDIYKMTEARKNDVYKTPDGSRADFQCGLQQMKSFTTEKIFSDPKFRLANALHETGVAQSTYARNVVRSVIPTVQERTTGIKPF